MSTTLILALLVALPAAFGSDCESLSTLAVPDTTITKSEAVGAGAFTPPSSNSSQPPPFAKLPAFCRVAATIRPTSDSEIKIEVWMPADGWNGKFMGVGNGGWSGGIVYPALAMAVGRGYAAASTNTGHDGGDASFAPGHPEKLVDFAYRAVHEMTVKAKEMTKAYYGTAMFDNCQANEGINFIRPVYSLAFWSNPGPGLSFIPQFYFGGGAGQATFNTPSNDTDTSDPNARRSSQI